MSSILKYIKGKPHFREEIKKNGKKAVRLTAWVDPPSPEAVIFGVILPFYKG